jgi:hypothetical protein
VVLLTVGDEFALQQLRADAAAAGLRSVAFHEPDLDLALTAVALEPAAHRLVRHLRLALAPGRQCPQETDLSFAGRRGVNP